MVGLIMGSNWYKNKFNKHTYLEARQMKQFVMDCLKVYDSKLTEKSGIYIITRCNKPRQDGGVTKYAYIGQAVNVLDRLASHFIGFKQRIDISLKTRGLFYPYDPYAWKIDVVYCSKEQLNELERKTISDYQANGYELYNITGGGQDEGKEYIGDKKAGLGYHDGLKQGRVNALKEVREYFEKYLDFQAKSSPECYKKPKRKNELPELKDIYKKKFFEFQKLLEGVKDE